MVMLSAMTIWITEMSSMMMKKKDMRMKHMAKTDQIPPKKDKMNKLKKKAKKSKKRNYLKKMLFLWPKNLVKDRIEELE